MKHSVFIAFAIALAAAGCDKNRSEDEAPPQEPMNSDEEATEGETDGSTETVSAPDSPSDSTTAWTITFPNGELPDLAGSEVKLEPRGPAYLFAGAPALVRLETSSPLGSASTPEDIKEFSIMHTKARMQCIYEPASKNLKFDFKTASEGEVTRLDFDGMLRCASIGPEAEAPLTKVAGTLRIE